jgi:hypothetical protein
VKLPTGAESREAERLGAERGSTLRRDASLLVICLDCKDTPILATVTWIPELSRPLVAAREQGDRLAPERTPGRGPAYSWADRGGFLHARAGAYRHVLYTSDVRDYLPAPGKPRRKMKVRHGPGGVSRPT